MPPDTKAPERETGGLAVLSLRRRYGKAATEREPWEREWRDCYSYTLPSRRFGDAAGDQSRIFDATAADAADQLAAGMLTGLVGEGEWFTLGAGASVPDVEQADFDATLARVTAALHAHFDRSNLKVELHQAFLDVVIGGSACLMFDEAPIGAPSAFRFRALPITECVLAEGPSGRIERAMRKGRYRRSDLAARFPGSPGAKHLLRDEDGASDSEHWLIEAVEPDGAGVRYLAALADAPEAEATLADTRLEASPLIAFRWMKAPGEVYGRSPVMKALPDIKTANKTVELILKNASIAATGIWQADDDGVLNPANIRLTPGAIIPKAVGSAGLTPLEAPGKFDLSQLVLDELRARIRHALLADKLGALEGPRMTATEVAERAAETARLLGAVYARMQEELLTPLIDRAVRILRRRGEIPDVRLDGRSVEIGYRTPVAESRRRGQALAVVEFLQMLQNFGPAAMALIDIPWTARWLQRGLGLPPELINEKLGEAPAALPEGDLAGLIEAVAGGPANG